jgi:DNA helicase-2/ATP-dependent DNA helicase PcrA
LQALLGYVTNINGQPYDLNQMYIGTVHSLCQKILADRRHFIVDRHRNRPPQLLDELGQYFHIAKNRNWQAMLEQTSLAEEPHLTINSIFGKQSQSKHNAIVNCSSIFGRFSEVCIDPQDALKRLGNASKKFTKQYTNQGFTLIIAYPESLAKLLGNGRYSHSLEICGAGRTFWQLSKRFHG